MDTGALEESGREGTMEAGSRVAEGLNDAAAKASHTGEEAKEYIHGVGDKVTNITGAGAGGGEQEPDKGVVEKASDVGQKISDTTKDIGDSILTSVAPWTSHDQGAGKGGR